MRAPTNLELVAAVPVSATLEQALGLVDVAHHEVNVSMEETDADEREGDVESLAEADRLVGRLAERELCFVLWHRVREPPSTERPIDRGVARGAWHGRTCSPTRV